jgi:hypothetical protein
LQYLPPGSAKYMLNLYFQTLPLISLLNLLLLGYLPAIHNTSLLSPECPCLINVFSIFISAKLNLRETHLKNRYFSQ